jgi:hypothetical protein
MQVRFASGPRCAEDRARIGELHMQTESSHPRYCPERKLPEHAYQPGLDQQSARPKEHHYDAAWNTETATLLGSIGFRWGVDLFNNGFYWEAHEAWEGMWLQAPGGSAARHVLQGLIQSSAAMLKARRGQWQSFESLLVRASKKFTKSRESNDCARLGWPCEPFLADVERYGEHRGEAVRPWIQLKNQ